MRGWIVSLLLLTSFIAAAQQPVAKIRKVPIGKTGCSYQNYCNTPFTVEQSADSSRIHRAECEHDGITYGIICVQLKNPVADLTMAEDLMVAYIDFLKKNFTITEVAGYSRGYRLQDSDSTRGIADRWTDSEGDQWLIRGWTNGKQLGVLYLYSQEAVQPAKAEEYFNGFRFGK
jgi:hypothetical protein